jgi:hypothetical protein
MTAEENTENPTRDSRDDLAPDTSKRFQSEIEFPYTDLQSAIEIVTTVHSRAGTSCEAEELAAWMNQSPTGGTFRARLAAARHFGLIDRSQGRVTLTQLGRQIIDPAEERHARVEAFLKVPLYSAMYDKNRGNVLPPPVALERQMRELGVSPKQTERARQAFSKSAQFAGFVDASTGRFVKPGNYSNSALDESKNEVESERKEKRTGGHAVGDELDQLHPFIVGLLRTLPPAQIGEPKPDWPIAEQVKWLQTAASIFSLIYEAKDGRVKIEHESS